MKKKLITTILLTILFFNIEICLNNYNSQIEVSNVIYMENETTEKVVSEVNNKNTYSGKVVYCGEKENKFPAGLPKFTSNIVKIIQFLIPVALILLGMYDFAMAVIANDEKKMKDSSSKFVRRLISGVLVFLVVAIVKLGFGLIKTGTNYLGCINCFLNNKCNTTSYNTTIKTTYACYQCNGDSSIYKWKTSNGSDSSCGSGYHQINGITKESDCTNNTINSLSSAYACYQCSSDLSVYKWSNNITKDSLCSGQYVERTDIKEQSKCNGVSTSGGLNEN